MSSTMSEDRYSLFHSFVSGNDLFDDIVLDIHDIQKYGQKLGNYVTCDTIQNGIHDLILSEKDSRDHVYRTVFDWLPGK